MLRSLKFSRGLTGRATAAARISAHAYCLGIPARILVLAAVVLSLLLSAISYVPASRSTWNAPTQFSHFSADDNSKASGFPPVTVNRLYLIWQRAPSAQRPLRIWYLKLWSHDAALQALRTFTENDVVYASLSWYSTDDKRLNNLQALSRTRCEVIVVVNDRDEVDKLSDRGIRHIHASHSAFIDENMYVLNDKIPESDRKHDIFVNSRFEPGKRADLAAGVSTAIFVGYSFGGVHCRNFA
jgi:hypothetical protein